MAEKWAKTSFPPSSGVMNPKPLLSLNHFTVPVAPLSMPGLVTVDVQSASAPSQVQVTFPPSFVHAHVAITCSLEASALDDETAVDAAGAALDARTPEAAALGVDAVVVEPQPERRSAPAAAKETTIAETVLGAGIARNLSSCPRCTRSVKIEYCFTKADEQIAH